MKEVLEKLLEAEILTEETKQELVEAYDVKMEEVISEAKEEAKAEVKFELTEQWITERDALIEAVDAKVTEFLNDELAELREDIDRFRDLEVEYASKLTEEKAQMADELKEDLAEVVEKMDSFLEVRLNAEIKELREDIEHQKQNVFGRKIFEAIADEFAANYAENDDMSETLAETKSRLEDTEDALKEAESKLSVIERKEKLNEVLQPLSGRQRDIMKAILENIATDQISEAYDTFIGKVLKEEQAEHDKGDELITEAAELEAKKQKLDEMKKDCSKKTGDVDKDDDEEEGEKLSEAAKFKLQKLAGLVK